MKQNEELLRHKASLIKITQPDTLKYLWIQLDQNKFRDDTLMSALTTDFWWHRNRGPATAGRKSTITQHRFNVGAFCVANQFVWKNTELGYDLQKVTDGMAMP